MQPCIAEEIEGVGCNALRFRLMGCARAGASANESFPSAIADLPRQRESEPEKTEKLLTEILGEFVAKTGSVSVSSGSSASEIDLVIEAGFANRAG